MAVPTRARVCEYFNYDPESGDLTFKERPRSEFRAPGYAKHLGRIGKVAGSVNHEGYRHVAIDGKYYLAHRIIWLMFRDEWPPYPEYEIDHKDGNPDNNRIENLRKGTKSQNQKNAGRRINNTSGVHGVNWKPRYHKPGDGRWVARIWDGPKHVYLGEYRTIEEAAAARKSAESRLGYTGHVRDGWKKAQEAQKEASA